MKITSMLMLVPLLLTPLSVASCSSNAKTELKVYIDGSDTLKVGENCNYTARFSVHEKTSGVQWFSSNKSILDIDENGNAKALKAGSVVIKTVSLRDNSVYASKTVSVVESPSPKYITILGENKIFVGASWQQKYSANVYPQDASQQVKWSVNTAHATISEDGLLTVSSSTVESVVVNAISVVNPTIHCQFVVNVVRPAEPESIEIFGSNKIAINTQWKYEVKTLPTSIESPCKWSLLNDDQETLANVDPYTGTVYAKRTGSIDLIAKSLFGNVISTKHIEIVDSKNIPIQANIIGPDILDHDSSATYSCTIDSQSTNQPVIWSASDNVEIIDKDETSIAIKPIVENFSPIYLTATLVNFPHISIIKKISNQIKPDKLEIKTPQNNEMGCHQFYHFDAIPFPLTACNDVYWTSSNTDVINIDNKTGYAQTISYGTSIIKCVSKMDSSIQSQSIISVNNDLSIEIEGPDKIYSGIDWNYDAKISSGEELPVNWSVSDTNIATFDEGKGVLQARKSGKIVLTATLIEHPEVVATKNITIYKPLKSLTITGDSVVPNSEDTPFKVKTVPEDGFPVVDWTTADGPLIGSINSDGVLHPLSGKEGSVVIVATSKYDSRITANFNVLITGDAIKIKYSPTIGKAYDLASSKYVIKDNDYVAQFISTQYSTDDESGDLLPIHKELKMKDVEILYGDDLINDECTLKNNFLVIPKKYINTEKSITINILGGEIADWIKWNDITSIANKDFSDDQDKPIEEQNQKVKDYFQIGDYKKTYEIGGDIPYKFYGTARLVSFYTSIVQISNEDMELENKYAPMQFEFEELLDTAIYDDNEFYSATNDIVHYILDKWWNLAIDKDILWPPQIKIDVCNRLCLDGVSPRSVCLDPEYSDHATPMNDSTFYLMDPEEYNISKDDVEYEYWDTSEPKDRDQEEFKNEWKPYMFYTNSYVTTKSLSERRTKPKIQTQNEDMDTEGYLTRRVLNVHTSFSSQFFPFTYIDTPGCIRLDGTECYFYYYTAPNHEYQEIADTFMWYCLAFSL